MTIRNLNRPLISALTLFILLQFGVAKISFSDTQEPLDDKNGTYMLNESMDDLSIWTDYPSNKIFKDDPVPAESGSGIVVYLAKNEFEPFQLIMNSNMSKRIKVTVSELPQGLNVELRQVEYIYLEQSTDSLGREGWYPDPLVPLEWGSELVLENGENLPLWLTIKADKNMLAGEYAFSVYINDIAIPVYVHIFDFEIPETLHVKSQINLSHKDILEKYGVQGLRNDYWEYVDRIKQFMIDHRLTPKSVLWSGGLTYGGGSPYINYIESTGQFIDPYGIWGFLESAARYLDGAPNVLNTYLKPDVFNSGVGFPSFMAMTFRNNDASEDQRPDWFLGTKREVSDWYTHNNLESAYNKKWFKYIADLESYLKGAGYIDKAYYYFANEPQNQEDYDAVSWYASRLKEVAPDLKLMISEEPRPEIYANEHYPNVSIDQWLPVLNNYNPEVSWSRELEFGEETWVYFLHGTKPPYFNPITLDHPGIESKLTGWFLWKYRIKGIAHYAFNDWSNNVWMDPMTSGHNGDNFMLYPPNKDNSAIEYGQTNHRFVSSIRFELLRDSLEDYEYLYRLNSSKQPVVYENNLSDSEVDKIIYGVTSYNRDSHFMYELRKNIGLKIEGEIDAVPEILSANLNERSLDTAKSYFINFQNPEDQLVEDPLVVDDKTYMKVGWTPYNPDLGYGWYGDFSHVMYAKLSTAPDTLKGTIIYDDWGREKVFVFDLPNGEYDVTVCCGWQDRVYAHNKIVIEGTVFIDDEATEPYLVRTKRVSVKDNTLTMEMGIFDEYTMLNYLEIIPVTQVD